jgi:hypothetical protein
MSWSLFHFFILFYFRNKRAQEQKKQSTPLAQAVGQGHAKATEDSLLKQ